MKKGPINPVRFAVVSGISASLIFLVLVGILAPGEFWGSVSDFAATLISVIAAFFVGVGLYERQVRAADARRRSDLTEALLAELSETIKALKDPRSKWAQPHTPPSGTEMPITYLQAVILEDAARSQLFNTTATKQIFTLIRHFGTYNLRISQVITLAAMETSAENNWGGHGSLPHRQQLNNLVRHIDESRESIVEQSEALIYMFQDGEHVIPETDADIEPEIPVYRRITGF